MSLSGSFSIEAALNNSKDDVDLSTPNERVNQKLSKSISAGKLYHVKLTLTSAETRVIDLGDGSLEDVYGQTITLAELTGMYISTAATNTTTITLSDGTNSIFNDQPPLSASQGQAFLTDIDLTTDSKLYFVNGAVEDQIINLIVTGTE
jgi:hypothetical protein